MEETSNAEAEELADQPTMISWKDVERCEALGLKLKWGQYYVFDRDSDDICDDDSYISIEEAEEATDEQIDNEMTRAKYLVGEKCMQRFQDSERANKTMYESTNDSGKTSPSLMGMPDILLEKIFQYGTKKPWEVCALERVCKRIHRMVRADIFGLTILAMPTHASSHSLRAVSVRSTATKTRPRARF